MVPRGHSPVVYPERHSFSSFYTSEKQSFPDAVERFMITGGTPDLNQFFQPTSTLYDSILRNLLLPDGPLYWETAPFLPSWLLEQEPVCKLLHDISMGRQRPERLANSNKLALEQVTQLLQPLLNDGLLRAEYSIEAGKLQQTDRLLYLFAHPFYRFWFRFVYPYFTALQAHDPVPVLEAIRKQFRRKFIPLFYHDICKDIFHSLCRDGQLDFKPEQTGSYWISDLNSTGSIRLVSADHQQHKLFLADYRYESTPMDSMVFFALEENACLAGTLPRAFPSYEFCYGLFSKSGFTKRIQNIAKSRDDIVLIQENQLVF